MDDDVYADFIAEVLTGGFAPPPATGSSRVSRCGAGQWSAERIAAHVARNHEELIRTSESILSGEEASFDNAEAVDERGLDRYVLTYRGLRGIADRLAQTVVVLRELAARLDERGSVTVPVRIRDGDRVVVDEPLPWGDVLKFDEHVHVPGHLEELRSRRVPSG